MRDRWFERTVVLLCHHTPEGALGLVINRDGPVSIGRVVEKMSLAPPTDPDMPTWWGGPVSEGAGFVIWKGKADEEEGWNIGNGVAVSPSVERLESLLDQGESFHLALGYSGWGPGQLDGELTSGAWIHVDSEPSVVFDTPLPDRYDSTLALLGLTPETVWMTPIFE
ncbi:MAG: YqgE/AlgH family protein [Myxococcota bacterium]|jgi:putative transcriptional regulator|nr:YqgE/AlgH family protein [Myxococcota bacterium]